MTERERALDELLCGIGFAMSRLLRNVSHEIEAADAIHELVTLFQAASRKQDDADRNAIRRKMGKADCAEPVKPD